MSAEAKHALLRDERVLRWLSDTLRRRFGGSEPSLEFPARGARTPVAVARWDGRAVIAKLFPDPARFVSSAFQLRYMRRRDLPVPELLYWSAASRLTTPRAFLAVEEFVPGHTLEDLPDARRLDGLDAVALALARLHACRRRSWGRVGLPRPGSYAGFYLRIARARLARLRGAVDDATLSRLADALADAAAAIPPRRDHALIHAHVNMGNFLVTDEAWLIDVGSAHFGDPARDLVRAVHRLCRGPEEAARLLDRYFGRAGPEARDAFARAEPFYACDYILRKTRKLADRWARERELEGDEISERVEATAALCHELLRADGPAFHERWPELR